MPENTATMADPGMQARMMQELLPFIMGKNTKFTVDENNDINLKTNYAQTQAKNLGAQTQATEKAGLPSYGGIDADMVLKLMGQRGQQDAQMAGQTGRDMQGMYQGALTQQILGDPQRREQDIRAKLAIQMLRDQASMGVTNQRGTNDMNVQGARDKAAMERVIAQNKSRENIAKLGGSGKSDLMEKKFLSGELGDAGLIYESIRNKKTDAVSGAWSFNTKVPRNQMMLLGYTEGKSPWWHLGMTTPAPEIAPIYLRGMNVGDVDTLAKKYSTDINGMTQMAIDKAAQTGSNPAAILYQLAKDSNMIR